MQIPRWGALAVFVGSVILFLACVLLLLVGIGAGVAYVSNHLAAAAAITALSDETASAADTPRRAASQWPHVPRKRSEVEARDIAAAAPVHAAVLSPAAGSPIPSNNRAKWVLTRCLGGIRGARQLLRSPAWVIVVPAIVLLLLLIVRCAVYDHCVSSRGDVAAPTRTSSLDFSPFTLLRSGLLPIGAVSAEVASAFGAALLDLMKAAVSYIGDIHSFVLRSHAVRTLFAWTSRQLFNAIPACFAVLSRVWGWVAHTSIALHIRRFIPPSIAAFGTALWVPVSAVYQLIVGIREWQSHFRGELDAPARGAADSNSVAIATHSMDGAFSSPLAQSVDLVSASSGGITESTDSTTASAPTPAATAGYIDVIAWARGSPAGQSPHFELHAWHTSMAISLAALCIMGVQLLLAKAERRSRSSSLRKGKRPRARTSLQAVEGPTVPRHSLHSFEGATGHDEGPAISSEGGAAAALSDSLHRTSSVPPHPITLDPTTAGTASNAASTGEAPLSRNLLSAEAMGDTRLSAAATTSSVPYSNIRDGPAEDACSPLTAPASSSAALLAFDGGGRSAAMSPRLMQASRSGPQTTAMNSSADSSIIRTDKGTTGGAIMRKPGAALIRVDSNVVRDINEWVAGAISVDRKQQELDVQQQQQQQQQQLNRVELERGAHALELSALRGHAEVHSGSNPDTYASPSPFAIPTSSSSSPITPLSASATPSPPTAAAAHSFPLDLHTSTQSVAASLTSPGIPTNFNLGVAPVLSSSSSTGAHIPSPSGPSDPDNKSSNIIRAASVMPPTAPFTPPTTAAAAGAAVASPTPNFKLGGGAPLGSASSEAAPPVPPRLKDRRRQVSAVSPELEAVATAVEAAERRSSEAHARRQKLQSELMSSPAGPMILGDIADSSLLK